MRKIETYFIVVLLNYVCEWILGLGSVRIDLKTRGSHFDWITPATAFHGCGAMVPCFSTFAKSFLLSFSYHGCFQRKPYFSSTLNSLLHKHLIRCVRSDNVCLNRMTKYWCNDGFMIYGFSCRQVLCTTLQPSGLERLNAGHICWRQR